MHNIILTILKSLFQPLALSTFTLVVPIPSIHLRKFSIFQNWNSVPIELSLPITSSPSPLPPLSYFMYL